jgi:hypothetical protein
MLTCPYCQQAVEEQAITCPHCHCQLKAHGHPGILLHRAVGEDFLCQTCLYDADDTCTFPQRPYARDCTLYRNQDQVKAAQELQQSLYPRRYRRLQVWLVLAGLVVLALLLALL